MSASVSAWGGASALERLRELLLGEGGLMASLVAEVPNPSDGTTAEAARRAGPETDAGVPQPDGVHAVPGPAQPAAPGPAQLAAAGPRAQGRREEYELLIEAIYEGYLLHYHAPRVVRPPEADLGVLAGDRLYALGLDRLVKLGDVQAVAELADVITLTALAHGDGRADIAQAIWQAGARAVGWGSSAAHERAKALARTGDEGALRALCELDGLGAGEG